MQTTKNTEPKSNSRTSVYHKNRRKFFDALDELRQHSRTSITPASLYRAAGLSKSTYYRHFKTIDQVLSEEENYLLSSFKQITKNIPRSDYRLHLCNFVIFIDKHRNYFRAAVTHHDAHLVRQLFEISRSSITKNWQLPSGHEDGFPLFLHSAETILKTWLSQNFPASDSIDYPTDQLLCLAKTFNQHATYIAHLSNLLKMSPQ